MYSLAFNAIIMRYPGLTIVSAYSNGFMTGGVDIGRFGGVNTDGEGIRVCGNPRPGQLTGKPCAFAAINIITI